ncbi:NTP transferase domain-containing protein [Salmonella enterica]|nr:NTP transferase domain-containing protein [Salmonella enterica subsp. enterica serovar Javiana]EEP0859184.1 NTP transferase domain-containing protein [Salmonella enterica]EGH8262065.1 NTP transferase domain-containing protein [Salmonella enterica]EGL2916302.1 NTP transferase domain-containing protein [Salmonella enterica]EJP9495741.1 glycosyltransferase family 2 protein [Salmonella enterica]
MLNIVIPMAGEGSRFANAGYADPKPFIDVAGVPMIELVISNLRPDYDHRFIFVCQQEHLQRYDFRSSLTTLAPGCEVIGLSGKTDGALCSVMQAAGWIDNDSPLIIANSDQWVDSDINTFVECLTTEQLDGLVMTMKASDAKWSYAQLNSDGWVTQVVEKEVISDEATVGIYGFTRGTDFCRFARRMIANNLRSQGEFYVAPVYTLMAQAGLNRIRVQNIGTEGNGMHGLGTPADLQTFLHHPVLERALSVKRVAA